MSAPALAQTTEFYVVGDTNTKTCTIVGKKPTVATQTIVTPSGISALDFLDEADTMNALLPELKKKGIEVLRHPSAPLDNPLMFPDAETVRTYNAVEQLYGEETAGG